MSSPILQMGKSCSLRELKSPAAAGIGFAGSMEGRYVGICQDVGCPKVPEVQWRSQERRHPGAQEIGGLRLRGAKPWLAFENEVLAGDGECGNPA